MDMRLVINTGSTSKKYALYHGAEQVFSARSEEGGGGYRMSVPPEGEDVFNEEISEDEYEDSLAKFLEMAVGKGIISTTEDITAVGIRIVAPGTYFTEHRCIDEDFLARFEEMRPYAPLHISPALSEIQKVQSALPHAELFGVSDSAFHTSMPEAVRRYSIKDEDTREYDIWRFGYHGLSVSSVMRKLETLSGSASRVIVCHVGGGVSVTAVKDGKCLDTSMGFSPVGGIHMGTRTGDIDPGAVIYLAQRKGLTYDDVREYLNKEGGFKGVTGVADMRVLLERYEDGGEKAKLAIEMFKNRMSKYVGGYIALLGGLDALVLTATACERNAAVRSLVCHGLEHLGILVDEGKNQSHTADTDGLINSEEGDAKIAVIHTDEMGEIAQTANILKT